MKNLIILLLLSTSIYAQPSALKRGNYRPDVIGLRLIGTQDFKLAFKKDDGHGNKAFTANVHTKIHFEEFDFGQTYGFPVVGLKWEYADLYSGYLNRYGVEIGYAFPIIKVKHKHFGERPLFRITPLFGYGYLERLEQNGAESFEIGCDVAIDITPRFSFVISNYFTERPEWGTMPYNLSGGIGYLF